MPTDATTPSNGGEPPVVARALAVAEQHHSAGRGDSAALLYREVLAAQPGNAQAQEGLASLAEPAAPRPRRSLPRRAARRYGRPALEALAQRPRILKYRLLSSCRVSGSPRILQPVLFVGGGEIVLGEDVQFGWKRSPLFYTGYSHVEAATEGARIAFGDRVEFNNNAFLKSEGPGIEIGPDGLFGAHVQIFDSNFHDLDPRAAHRRDAAHGARRDRRERVRRDERHDPQGRHDRGGLRDRRRRRRRELDPRRA